MLKVIASNKGTESDPIPVPVLKSHVDQKNAYTLRLQIISSYGVDDIQLFKLFTRSHGIWVGQTKYEKIPGGVEVSLPVYLTEDLVGDPDTVTLIAKKYAYFFNEKPIAGKTEGTTKLYFTPITLEEPDQTETDKLVDEVVEKAIVIVVDRLTGGDL